MLRLSILATLIAASSIAFAAENAAEKKVRTTQEVIDQAQPGDWRPLDPENTLYMEFDTGRVVLELAPQFAPNHAANIRTLVREHYFDGLAIIRVQDNYVTQWGDADSTRQIHEGKRTLPPEFTRPAKGLAFTPLPDPDTYAKEVGFSNGFPAARDMATNTAWPVHCYGMVGAGRDNDVASGGGTELYTVIGSPPRQLDRNITLVGRVVRGMALLSALPRGTEALGFYKDASQRVPIKTVRMAADVPEGERLQLEELRTDTKTFGALVESRRNRHDDWYKVAAGHIDVCSVPVPVRVKKK
jgi:peptidylprolyl isomerase